MRLSSRFHPGELALSVCDATHSLLSTLPLCGALRARHDAPMHVVIGRLALVVACWGSCHLGCVRSSVMTSAPSSRDPITAATVQANPLPARPRPPIAASRCSGLSSEELSEASEYLLRYTRIRPLYPKDGTFLIQQRYMGDNPGLVVGVEIYVPGERGMNRAYVERLLSCHAVAPPALVDHPNDPLLAPGIIAVSVEEADGGEYRISIRTETNQQARALAERTRMLRAASGSVSVQQIDTPLDLPSDPAALTAPATSEEP